MKQATNIFWDRHPALLYGLALLLGISSILSPSAWLFLPISLLVLSSLGWRLLFATLMGISGAFYAFISYEFPLLQKTELQGLAHLSISSVTPTQTHFGKFWTYKGTLHQFLPDSPHSSFPGRNIPFSIAVPRKKEFTRPPANRNYLLQAKIKQSKIGSYYLVAHKDAPWKGLKGTWSFAEWRFNAKRAVENYLKRHILSKRAATFLTGIATGEFDDRLMIYEFSRFGLQHLMAISGFHFGIIAYLSGLLLSCILPYRTAQAALIFLLTSYCLFLGWAPSIMRSWITILIALGGRLLGREGNGLNSLGIALVIILMVDPLAYKNAGFQFSFAVTASILLFYTPMHEWMLKVYPKRKLSQIKRFSFGAQHAYILLAAFRTTLSLSLAVTVVAFPMTLAIFQKFPLLSLLYNLFFPFLVSFSMLFLLLALFFSWIPLISSLFHTMNTYYTEGILGMTYELPGNYDIVIRNKFVESNELVIYLSLIFSIGLIMSALRKKDEEIVIF